jgi:hypothetical protein
MPGIEVLVSDAGNVAATARILASYPIAENSPSVWTAHCGITRRARSGRLGITEGLRANVCFGPIRSAT